MKWRLKKSNGGFIKSNFKLNQEADTMWLPAPLQLYIAVELKTRGANKHMINPWNWCNLHCTNPLRSLTACNHVQRQTAVTAHLTSKQLLLFAFEMYIVQHRSLIRVYSVWYIGLSGQSIIFTDMNLLYRYWVKFVLFADQKSQLLGMKWMFRHRYLQMFGLKLKEYE